MQKAFNKVWHHFVTLQSPASYDAGPKYNLVGGKQCPVGLLLGEHYHPSMEGHDILSFPQVSEHLRLPWQFLYDLEQAHDLAPPDPDEFHGAIRANLEQVAVKYGLYFYPTIVSGGQTGADRAALDWAAENGVPTVGYCPKGRKAEDGVIPACYLLTETRTASYTERTRRNVELAYATVIFSRQPLGKGSKLTVSYAIRAKRPYKLIDPFSTEAASELKKFLIDVRPPTLNVAGSRESRSPGIYMAVYHLLRSL